MADLFGKLMGMGMNPQHADLYKTAKKQLNRGRTPAVPKKDGTMGQGVEQKKKAPGGPSIWERIARAGY